MFIYEWVDLVSSPTSFIFKTSQTQLDASQWVLLLGLCSFYSWCTGQRLPKVLGLGLVIIIVNLYWGLLRHLALWYICRRKIVFNILKWDSPSLNNKPKITPLCKFLGPSTLEPVLWLQKWKPWKSKVTSF